ncbi:MAG TPA: nitrite reductase small subunit NirD [Deltaproteobacteria bacterium]|nr:nitrite reductase small subunit NirD [Deltaproteobacteria bacterium]
MEKYRVCSTDQIPRGTGIRVRLKDKEIALFRTKDDRFFALENRCPHRDGPISEGMLSGTTLICPLHNMRIELSTGTLCNGGNEEYDNIRVFRVEHIDGYVWIYE